MAWFDRTAMLWLGAIAVTLIGVFLQGRLDWLATYPETGILPVADLLNAVSNWIVRHFAWLFQGMSALLECPIKGIQQVLQALPWSVAMFLFCLAAYAASGWRLALFTLGASAYMLVIGAWDAGMNTLSLVAISVPSAILVGFAIGVWGFRSRRAERIIMPTLDILQTVPTFAYLLPILMLFGFGTVVGLISSILYSFPPMVRNTLVGLRSVAPEVIESGLMAGATGRQLFWQVRVPSARRQLMLGVNQATMASLSMVIIASVIGGTADLGWEVLSTIRKAQFGESLLVGLVIALMAMVIDRVSSSFAEGSDRPGQTTHRRRLWLIAALGAVLVYGASLVAPILNDWPAAFRFNPAPMMNEALSSFITTFRTQIEMVKTAAFYFVMLPAKIGLQGAVSPFTWGFALTPLHQLTYAAGMIALALWSSRRGSPKIGIAVLIFAVIIYFGLTGLPWPALILIIALVAHGIGGAPMATGTAMGLLFIVVTGNWPAAVLSIYLCGIAVVIAFTLGTAIGIWAAQNDRVSAIVRPINDTLQTMPLFVILIPFVMVFKIGDFTALLAIIAYAIVPAIRYGEHGLRGLPETVIEAARMIGATPRQMLWQVKIPLALPVMMLGLNQTILHGIAMLVIAALVGAAGLEQTVYIALTDGNVGQGLIAGLAIAIIAIIADRMTSGWSRNRQAALGFGAR
ncbi:ABC transporter permease subunit [Tabrizicola sp.]|uniref:ABC transporter permease n=1 Tax=Tabrizicola sp. TaxID=2005166 RepID=UPI00262A6BE8|nr:ABC transporter permease subunit [Tabrizicola sp.]MDM7931497.1 ABC transporter permease subunit [Tabrizicola sp.]